MRDALLDFGAISLATKDTAVSAANSIKLGAIDSRSVFSSHRTGRAQAGFEAVFVPSADFVSVDSFIPFIEDSADGSSWTTILTGAQCAGGIKAGVSVKMPIPNDHRQYIRAGCTPKSTGTFTAKTVNAWLEAGPN
ncbi:MAG: hypothetical protein KKB59_14140 [Spirochaetes bacterium]|nr:hypothetical protein [Spirochaetota bacterium]